MLRPVLLERQDEVGLEAEEDDGLLSVCISALSVVAMEMEAELLVVLL